MIGIFESEAVGAGEWHGTEAAKKCLAQKFRSRRIEDDFAIGMKLEHGRGHVWRDGTIQGGLNNTGFAGAIGGQHDFAAVHDVFDAEGEPAEFGAVGRLGFTPNSDFQFVIHS